MFSGQMQVIYVICNRFWYMSEWFFLSYQTFKKYNGFDQNWPVNGYISAKIKQDIIVYFYWLETEFENLKKDKRYTYSF